MAPLGLIMRQVNKMIIGGGMAYTFLKIKDSTSVLSRVSVNPIKSKIRTRT